MKMDGVRDFLKKWWPSLVTALLAGGMTYVLFLLGCEDAEIDNPRPRSEIIRNYGLLIAAFWAAVFAVWRGQIASQQVETALRQSETSERGLNDGRFQKGADMLGSQDIVTRMGGIYALEHLAKDHSDGYYRDQIIKLLATFVRSPVPDDELEKRIEEAIAQSGASGRKFRENVSEAVRIICDLNSNEDKEHHSPDLSGSNFSNMRLAGLNFTGMNLMDVQFVNANLNFANLTGSNLTDADCIAANLTRTTPSSAKFTKVNFTGADLTDALPNAASGAYMTTRQFHTGQNFRGADFTGADFNGADFNGTNISGVSCSEEAFLPPI